MPNYITIPSTATGTTYSEDQLIEMVKLRMDEIDAMSGIKFDVGMTNNKPMSGMIDGLLNESRLDVLKNANVGLVPKATASINSSSMTVGDGFALMNVPDDCIRMVSVKCTSWKKTVTAVRDMMSKEYSRQQYKYARSGVRNPAVIHLDGNTYSLHPFQSSDNADIVYVSSLVEYKSFSEHMIDAICWICASKILSILDMADGAARASEIYNSIIK